MDSTKTVILWLLGHGPLGVVRLGFATGRWRWWWWRQWRDSNWTDTWLAAHYFNCCNWHKTPTIYFSQTETQQQSKQMWRYKNTHTRLQSITSFHIQQLQSLYLSLSQTWHRYIDRRTSVGHRDACVTSVITYSAELWTHTAQNEKKIDANGTSRPAVTDKPHCRVDKL